MKISNRLLLDQQTSSLQHPLFGRPGHLILLWGLFTHTLHTYQSTWLHAYLLPVKKRLWRKKQQVPAKKIDDGIIQLTYSSSFNSKLCFFCNFLRLLYHINPYHLHLSGCSMKTSLERKPWLLVIDGSLGFSSGYWSLIFYDVCQKWGMFPLRL